MNATTLVKMVKAAAATDEWNLDDNGQRVRVTKECREMGPDVVELSSGYFYSSQASLPSVVETVENYTGVTLEPVSDTRDRWAVWPNPSWMIRLYRVVEAAR